MTNKEILDQVIKELTGSGMVGSYPKPFGKPLKAPFFRKPRKRVEKRYVLPEEFGLRLSEEDEFVRRAFFRLFERLEEALELQFDANTPIPREVADKLAPESRKSIKTIKDLEGDRVIGSLENIQAASEEDLLDELSEKGYRWVILRHPKGCEIIYSFSLDPTVLHAVTLRSRDLGIQEPPLSADEHYQLGRYFGKSEKDCQRFKDALMKAAYKALQLNQVPKDSLGEAMEAPTQEQWDKVLKNINLARKAVELYGVSDQYKEEMFDAALDGLIKAVQRYNPDLGTAFSTFAMTIMKRLMLNQAKRIRRASKWKDIISPGAIRKVRQGYQQASDDGDGEESDNGFGEGLPSIRKLDQVVTEMAKEEKNE